MTRQNIATGTSWEPIVGTRGPSAWGIGCGSPGRPQRTQRSDRRRRRFVRASQTGLANIEAALRSAGATLADVVRTRIYVTDIHDWEKIGQAHGEVFREIRPATSMVEVRRLISPEILVEIEADAVIGGSSG